MPSGVLRSCAEPKGRAKARSDRAARSRSVCAFATADNFPSSGWPTPRRSRRATPCVLQARPKFSSAAKSAAPSRPMASVTRTSIPPLCYRKEFVAHCTCDNKDAFGLVPLDVKDDPTLRPGDIISTRDGFVTYSAKRDQTTFTPVDPSTVTAQLSPGSLRVRLSRRTQAASSGDDLTGTIVSSPDAANPSLMSELRGQLVR